jgi:hypothetical protein
MATSVKGLLVVFALTVAMGCEGGPGQLQHSLPSGCPANAAPDEATELHACVSALDFDTLTASGDEQRLMVREAGSGPACHGGDTMQTCRYGPLAKIEPVVGGHDRANSELDEGRIIARLFLRQGENESYTKLGLVPGDTTYWWVQRQNDTTAISQYLTLSDGQVTATPEDTIKIEVHPQGTFTMALARFIWDDADEKTQGPCGVGCCRGGGP